MPLYIIVRCDKCNQDITNNYNSFTVYKQTNPNDDLQGNAQPLVSQEFFYCDDCLNDILYPNPIDFNNLNNNEEY